MKKICPISQQIYNTNIFYLRNNYEQPSLEKITLFIDYKFIKFDKKYMLSLVFLLYFLSNQQKPKFQTSRKNIINFRIRKGDIIGTKIILNKKRLDDVFQQFNQLNIKILTNKFDKKVLSSHTQEEFLKGFLNISSNRIPFVKILNFLKNINLIFSFSTKSPYKRRFLMNLYSHQNN